MSVLLAADLPARELARDKVRDMVQRLAVAGQRNLAEVLRVLDDARARLVAQLATGSEFDMARARTMIAQIEQETRRLRDELRRPLADGFRSSLTLGDADALAKATAIIPEMRFTAGVSVSLIEVANERSADLVGQITEKARSDLNAIMRKSGMGTSRPADVAKALGTVLSTQNRPTGAFGTLSTQIERVHRTETAGLYEAAGKVRAARIALESPFELSKRWITIIDRRTRDSHLEMNGVVVPQDGKFTVSGVECDGPHDSVLPAEEVVNCRCTLALVRGPRKDA